jgi:ankyrin repeat protein
LLDPDRLLDYSLIWAVGHGRREIVEYLLDKNPDLTVTEPVFNSTALGAAPSPP